MELADWIYWAVVLAIAIFCVIGVFKAFAALCDWVDWEE